MAAVDPPVPWAQVRLVVEFPYDVTTWHTVVPVYDGETVDAAIGQARDWAMNGFVRNAACRAAEKAGVGSDPANYSTVSRTRPYLFGWPR